VEQHDRAVGHQGFGCQPLAKLPQVDFCGHPKPQVPPHLGLVVRAGLGPHAVAGQHPRIDAELVGHEAHCPRRGSGHVVGAEAQHPQPTQLERPTEPVCATVTPAYLGQIGIAEREEPVEDLCVEVWREPRQPLTLFIRQEPGWHTPTLRLRTCRLLDRVVLCPANAGTRMLARFLQWTFASSTFDSRRSLPT